MSSFFRAASSCALVAVALAAMALPFFTWHVAFAPVVLPAYLQFDLGTSLLAAPFFLIIGLVAIATAIWGLKGGGSNDCIKLAMFALSMIAVLAAQSVFAFALCWELMALVSVFLVATHHRRRPVRRAAFAYMLVSQIGSLCILTALAVLAVHAQSGAFAEIISSAATLPSGERLLAITLGLVGFGSKAGLVPLQFWLPRAHPIAPAGASAMLSAVMLKIAVYGAILLLFALAAPAPAIVGFGLTVVGVLSAIVGALYALIESELKRLLAYSSVENIGVIFATIGLAVVAKDAGSVALAALALCAGLLHAFNHAVFKGLLFLSAGTVVDRMNHVTDLDQLGGLASGPLRLTAPFVLIGCLAASALPPLNGFVSEWLVFRSFISALRNVPLSIAALATAAIAVLAIAGGLAAAAFIKMYGTAFLGAPRAHRDVAVERGDPAVAGVALLAAVCVLLGIAPMVALRPLASLAAIVAGSSPIDVPTVSWLPALAVLPVIGGVFAFTFARVRRPRRVPTWACGSPVGPRSQYSATVLSKPLRLIFAFALMPERRRVIETGTSSWTPVRISYTVSTRYLVDEAARWSAALVQRLSRRARIIQGGRLRVYLTYALAAFALMLILAR